jgi:hypothetical protein
MRLQAVVLACVLAAAVSCAGCAVLGGRVEAPPSEPAPAFDAMVVGTAHRGHLTVAGYPFSKLDETLDAFHPDLVLVEIRPQAFAEGRYEDGPIEMSYVTLKARARGIAVEPIDWYLDSDVGREPNEDPARARAYQTEVGILDTEVDRYDTFEVLNGPKRAQDFLRVENAAARHGLSDNAAWHRRQSWFHRQAVVAIDRHHARRVAAFVGFAHRPELDAWLRTAGGRSISPVSALAALPVLPGAKASPAPSSSTPSSSTPVSADVLQVWREGIGRLRRLAETAEPHVRKRLVAKIKYWEIALERRGLCCVDEKAFASP